MRCWASCDSDAVAAAAAAVRVPGRLQQIGSDPLTLLDGAHNPDGMRALAESLPELVVGHDRVVAIVSILDDKDAAGMLATLGGGRSPHRCAHPHQQSESAGLATAHPAIPGPPAPRAAGRDRAGPPQRAGARAASSPVRAAS